MAKIICNMGIPASGKSTYAKSLKIFRVCRDDIREELFGAPYKFTKAREKRVTEVRDERIAECVNNGHHVVVDETFCSERAINAMQLMVDTKCRVGTIIVWRVQEESFDVDLCHKRNTARERSVPYDVIENMYRNMIKILQTRVEFAGVRPLWIPRQEKIDKMLEPSRETVVICDLDGTLAISEGRSPFAWSSVDDDKVNLPVLHTIDQFPEIVFLSGRDGICKQKTRDWLTRYGYGASYLGMRKAGDMRKDYIVKGELLQEYFTANPEKGIMFMLDDRNQIVRFYRALGLPVFQVNDGFF